MRYSIETHVGRVRSNNEDYAQVKILDNNHLIAIVADGIGGHNAGEVASKLATEIILENLSNIKFKQNQDEYKLLVEEAIREANKEVYLKSRDNYNLHGMGTTIVVLLITTESIIISHLGDSRLYGFKEDKMVLLTEDHSFAQELLNNGKITKEEAKNHPQRHIITRSLGVEENVNIDTKILLKDYYSKFLICSDGLTDMVDDEDILAVVSQESSVDEKTKKLIELALNNGGLDNITVLLVELEEQI